MQWIKAKRWMLRGGSAALAVSLCAAANTQLSPSAYRALGQPNLQQNGVNMVEGSTLHSPTGIALDASGHLYVADTLNHRVLGWESATNFQNGAPAALVLGQPNPQQSVAEGIGPNGLAFPSGVAVDPITGDLFVADSGNNRVVRFLSPYAKVSNNAPDAVYGQPNFNSRAANAGGISAKTMASPLAVACDGVGNLWVADTGNNRVLRFPASVLNATNPAADLVVGQASAATGTANRGGAVSGAGFNSPRGLVVDSKNNLYVADYLNYRVLLFQAPLTAASSASVAYGQPKFTTRGLPNPPTAASLAGPMGLALGPSGALYVAVPADSRVLVFSGTAVSGAAATGIIGQPNFTTNTPDAGAFPEASATSFAGVTGVAVDANGNVLAADSGNNRVLFFGANASTATRVLGQGDFAGNGPNQIKPGSINSPYKIAIDYSHSPFALYVSDTNNNRVLIWTDSAHFHTGDPANLVIGQPNLTSAVPNVDSGGTATPSATGLYAPRGIALEADGDLFVADSGNNRVLHYQRPVAQSGRITPDVVLAQPDFTTSALAEVSASSLNTPAGVAVGPNGDVFIADSGNNRVVEFASRPKTGATALRVYGQSSFSTSTLAGAGAATAQTLTVPQGLTVDASYNLYVADAGANRVVIYPGTNSAPATGSSASLVLGQDGFTSTTVGRGATGLHEPFDVGLDSGGDIFVSDAANNRVVAYPSLVNLLLSPPYSAYEAVGQADLTTIAPNWDTTNGSATPEGLWAPTGIFVDRQDTLYVGDTGNNRVVQFLKGISVENAATLQAGAPVARGSLCTLMGAGLSTSKQHVNTKSDPNLLADRQLVVNGQFLAPLSYISPTQINFVLPWETPLGTQAIAVRLADTGEPIAGGTVSVAPYAPGLFTSDGKGLAGNGQAQAFNQDNTANSPSNPAALGSVVHVLGTGQGAVVSPVKDGQPAPSTQDNTAATPTSNGVACLSSKSLVCVGLGGSGGGATFADIQYSGLAPGMVGVWQLSFTIPASGLLGNTVKMFAAIGGLNVSNIVTIAVK
jgi:uncharacterized protein (TIGR03437 family)